MAKPFNSVPGAPEDFDSGGMAPTLNSYELAELELIRCDPERRKIALENYIIVWGSHEKIISARDENKNLIPGLNSLLPEYPRRESVRRSYSSGIARSNVLRRAVVQNAEESGLISILTEREYMRRLLDKASMLHHYVSKLGLVDWDKLSRFSNQFLRIEGGGYRRL